MTPSTIIAAWPTFALSSDSTLSDKSTLCRDGVGNNDTFVTTGVISLTMVEEDLALKSLVSAIVMNIEEEDAVVEGCYQLLPKQSFAT